MSLTLETSRAAAGGPRDPFGPRFVRWLARQLGRVGIGIDVFLVTAEGAAPAGAPISVDERFSAGWAGPEDVDELVRVEPGTPAALCEQRLRTGFLCFAVKDGRRIVAKMWCDLKECNDPVYRRYLGPREAYLFNAYTDPAMRGRNLAPYMRQQCYAALQAIGRDRVFSCTDYTNWPARRFKAKLGAVDERLCVAVSLFGRDLPTLTLRRYAPAKAVARS